MNNYEISYVERPDGSYVVVEITEEEDGKRLRVIRICQDAWEASCFIEGVEWSMQRAQHVILKNMAAFMEPAER